MTVGARIAIVTVVLNAYSLLEETICSVIKHKKDEDIDYIIVDGGSTDGTVDIIKKYADRLAYWASEKDAGIYDAMNKGWAAAAENSFILFLGAGDRLISLPDIELYTDWDVIYGSVSMGDGCVFSPRADFHLKLYNSLHHQALLVRKACHRLPPFDTGYRIYADFDLNQRLMKSGARFVYSPGFTTYAHPGGISDRHDFLESLRIILTNFGVAWMLLAVAGYAAMKLFPPLKRLRPF